MNEHEFLNADKSNLALQTLYFTDSLKNFNDIAVHSKMMLELIAKRILGQPKVIPTVYLTDGDFSPPVDEVVAIRAMVMSTQTTPVVITVNGIIPMLVSTVPTQIVTGPISSVTVGNTVPGNPVYVQYLDERAALLSNTSTQDDVAVNGTVSLTGSLPPLSAGTSTIGSVNILSAGSKYIPVLPQLAGGGGSQYAAVNAGGGNGAYIAASSSFLLNWLNGQYFAPSIIPDSSGVPSSATSGINSVAITTATTTSVKSSAGVIGTLINAGTATSGVITIFDNTTASGKTIWSGALTAGQVLALGIPCGTGITIVTAAADTITISYA